MTETPGTPAFIADATADTPIAYIRQSVDFSTGTPVVTDTLVETTIVSITRLSNGNTPKIQWTDSEGDVHNTRPDFYIWLQA